MNQCDGCVVGMPVKDGKHYMGTHPEMVCTKDRYLCVCGIKDCPDAPEHAVDAGYFCEKGPQCWLPLRHEPPCEYGP